MGWFDTLAHKLGTDIEGFYKEMIEYWKRRENNRPTRRTLENWKKGNAIGRKHYEFVRSFVRDYCQRMGISHDIEELMRILETAQNQDESRHRVKRFREAVSRILRKMEEQFLSRAENVDSYSGAYNVLRQSMKDGQTVYNEVLIINGLERPSYFIDRFGTIYYGMVFSSKLMDGIFVARHMTFGYDIQCIKIKTPVSYLKERNEFDGVLLRTTSEGGNVHAVGVAVVRRGDGPAIVNIIRSAYLEGKERVEPKSIDVGTVGTDSELYKQYTQRERQWEREDSRPGKDGWYLYYG